MNVPEELLRNPHFARYYRTWQKNEASIVFVPLAQICREQGLFDEAREICEKGLSRHPDSVSGRLMLARIFFDQDQTAQSRRIVERVLQEFPGQQEALTLLARINRIEGRIEGRVEGRMEDRRTGCEGNQETGEGDEEITEISSKPDSPLWENVTMAKIYADQGEIKIARQMLDRILARRPDDARALELRSALQKAPQKETAR